MITVQELVKLLEEEDALMLREVYTITLTRPAGVSANAMKRHIKEAIETWTGSRTGDPLFGAALDAVVRRKLNEDTHEPEKAGG